MSNSGLAGFESVVKDSEATWEPKQTGSKKTKDLVPLIPNEKSFIIGWYKGSKIIEKDGQTPSTVHKIVLKEVGDKNLIIGELGDDKVVGIWGTGVLNAAIAENVQVGQCIAIVWKGKTEAKKAGGNDYHNWDVMVNPSIEPMNFAGTIPSSTQAAAIPTTNAVMGASAVSSDTVLSEEDDDMPF